ncbi:hypothetical protein IAR55_001731 [Kwoniella newhampshirensis]|uniref:Glycosyltransferase 61 catalytic domain-containing protein n=1 Tax=Kwoniella newhampshirensis TaxID=1651941 RepID=A0AAW0Z302_9TREE
MSRLHRPRRSSSPASLPRSRTASPNPKLSTSPLPFDLRLPLAQSSSPSSPISGGEGLLFRKMATTRRGNRYLAGVLVTLGVFAVYHSLSAGGGPSVDGRTSGGALESYSARWKGIGWGPSKGSVGSTATGVTPVDDTSFVDLSNPVSMPQTRWVEGVAGFNYFQNLYLSNGTFLAITSDPSSLPDVEKIMSAFPDDDGHTVHPAGLDRWSVLVPGEDDLSGLGGVAVRKVGISMFFNDQKGKKSVSFLKHYFHFIGEVFLGAWRVLTTAGETQLPTRLMYRTTPDDWRDRAGLTAWFQQSVMPNTAVEESPIWEDREKSGMTFLFDKITITDRWTAHQKGLNPWRFNKMTADLPLLDAPLGWMDPLRSSMKKLVQTKGCSVYRQNPDVPVVLYINRQLTGRRLIHEDAEELSREMRKLDAEGVIEWMDVQMETKSRVEQFCLALRADVIMGVHGNGLSHALWMKPGSAVLEFMMPGGFARDYATVAELMRHDYYSIHKNEVFTQDKWLKPDGWGVGTVQGFHGTSIPLDGKWIAGLIRQIAKDKKDMVEP